MATQAQQDEEREKKEQEREEDVELLKKVLNDELITPLPPQDALALAKRFKKREQFKEARNLLAEVLNRIIDDQKLKLKLTQLYALCTYKDPGLPNEARLNRAFEILQGLDKVSKYPIDREKLDDRGPESTTDQETLGLAGSIFKQQREANGNLQDLWRSLGYYLRGHEVGPRHDNGYTSINAAFLCDLLAEIEVEHSKVAGIKPVRAEELWKMANTIRECLVRELPSALLKPGNQWLEREAWYLATVAEAYFGLGNYQEALSWLKKIDTSNILPWEIRSIIQPLVQLASFSRFGVKAPEVAQEVVAEFVGDKETVSSFFTLFKGQKVGLALSGGGFRASLFHLGVLARLAELDILRHIEVLSCVSGGSIVGAQYYLELRQLLQENADNKIEREDYVALINRMTTTFLKGVQQNLRTRIILNPWFSLKMLWCRSYSQTLRLGELFEKHLYAKVKDGEGEKPRWLNKMAIVPKDQEGRPYADFHPNKHNWNRRNKVPALILNATTLNTGNAWQFTATYMGEPRMGDALTDGSDRLRRVYYKDTPSDHKEIRLGEAVAASVCVPGLFEPVSFPDLYEKKAENENKTKKITVRLVDGGVYDNQGVESLLEQNCTRILMSDASGQLDVKDEPKAGRISALFRATGILQNRVRNTLYRNYDARGRASLLQVLMSVHLKKGLTAKPIPWRGCSDIADVDWESPRPKNFQLPYGIPETVQQSLSQIRTDLDSFSDKEAYALMASGYYMAKKELADALGQEFSDSKKPHDWPFLDPQMTTELQSSACQKSEEPQPSAFIQLLSVGQHRLFKAWKISKPLRVFSWGALLVTVIANGVDGVYPYGESVS